MEYFFAMELYMNLLSFIFTVIQPAYKPTYIYKQVRNSW